MHAGAWDYALTSPITLADLPHTTARTLRTWRYARQQRHLEQALQYRDAQFQRAQRHEAIAAAARLTAHDVNNSLSFILGYTQMALDETPHDSKTRRFLLEVQKAGQEAKDRVQQFLTFGRSADQPLTRVSFQAMVTAVLERFRDAYAIPLRLEASEDLGMVLANEAQLQQAFLYLCARAAHAIDEPGSGLTIRIDRVESDTTWPTQHLELPPGGYLRIRVHPSSHAGLCEPEETHAEPMFRPGRSSGRTELELAIVRAIVASHHGAFDVPNPSNQAFVVYLPHVTAGPPSHS
jgi:signal transduction histidine kinase